MFIKKHKLIVEEQRFTADNKKSEQAEKDAQQKRVFDQFLAQHPHAAMAVMLREIELRTFSVMKVLLSNSNETAESAYAKTCKGQSLSLLEDHVFNMKAQIQADGMPFLEQRNLYQHVRRLTRQKKDPGDPRGRSPSKSQSSNAQPSNAASNLTRENLSRQAAARSVQISTPGRTNSRTSRRSTSRSTNASNSSKKS